MLKKMLMSALERKIKNKLKTEGYDYDPEQVDRFINDVENVIDEAETVEEGMKEVERLVDDFEEEIKGEDSSGEKDT